VQAERWLVSQFAFNLTAAGAIVAPFFVCVAVSRSSDPTGRLGAAKPA
jgi:hypothetical protein